MDSELDPGPTVGRDVGETLASEDDARRTLWGSDANVELERGQIVGRHLVLRRLGSGAMGVVYAAHDPELDRQIALKLLHGSDDDAARERLLREARAMARLSHPNVVTVHDVGRHESAIFIAMEFVDGGTLRSWTESADRGVAEVTRVFADAARGLAAAHHAGLVHRDFKPDNVMIGQDGRVRVMDFGLAGDTNGPTVDEPESVSRDAPRLSSSRSLGQVNLTRTGAIMGTPAYMAPEQHLGHRSDARTDQFAFCVALYEALNGVRPFAGDTLPVLAFNVVQGKTRDEWGSDVPTWLRDAIARGLAVEPDSRWPTLDALVQELVRDRATPRARRRALVGGVVALGLAGAAGAGLSKATPSPKCTGAAQRVAEVWSSEHARSVMQSFDASSRPFAPDSVERVVGAMDAWAADWTRTHTATCEATHVHGTQSSHALDRRMSCLEDRRREAGALVELLSQADDALIERSVTAVSGLGAPAACAELEASGLEPPPPALTERVDSVRAMLARVRARRHAGHFEEGAALAADALQTAEAIGWAPLEAESAGLVGALASDLGRSEEAESALTRAFFGAVAVGRDDVATDAAMEMIYTMATGRGRHAEALVWSRHADALMRRAGDEGRRAALLTKRASVLTASGDTTGAIESLVSAAELARTDPTLAADIANAMGNAHAAAGAFDEALASYRRGLTLATDAHGPDHPSVVIAAFNIGTIHERRGALDEADEAYRIGGERFGAVFGPKNAKVGDAALNRGNIAQSRDRPDEAARHYATALEIYEAALDPAHPRIADLLGVMANLAADQGDIARSFALQERAIAIYTEAHGAEHPDVGLARFNRAWVLLGEKRNAEAEAEFADLVKIFDPVLPDGHPYRAFFHGGLADVLSQRGAYADAIPHYRAALVGEGLPPPDRASVELSLAIAIDESGGDRADARAAGQAALERYATLGEVHEQGRRSAESWLEDHPAR